MTATKLDPASLTTVWLRGDQDTATVLINDGEVVDYIQLPASRAALVAVAVWLSVAHCDSTQSNDDKLVAGTRAAARLAWDLPPHVRVNFSMNDGVEGRWLSFDVATS